jgi:UDP-N-acetylglucosamine--N-acetylmuramyl-(pentapeptide) pyrophosphoryl-undecaprenol N-acetylglucosamine transferase
MKILLSGGGTGGHITPILAVARELKKLRPDCYIIYVGERGDKFAALSENNPDIDEIKTIHAGKFRRYYGESWLRRLIDIKTNLLNIRDFFYFLLGIFESRPLLGALKPDVVFLKGSFVGLPVGIAAHRKNIPIITHDSDAMPGMANRLVARWATWHATGMPPEFYTYPKEATKYVGVLVGASYQYVDANLQAEYKKQLKIPENSQVLVITGGSGGAGKINEAMSRLVPNLLQENQNLFIIHQIGINKTNVYKGFNHERLKVFELLHPMYVYTGAGDIVVSRAGANTMAELGVQAKACIVIPNPLLTGGHQLKNAEYLEQQGAAMIIDETSLTPEPDSLKHAISDLLNDSIKRRELGDRLNAITVSDAAHKLAMLLLETANDNVQKKETDNS